MVNSPFPNADKLNHRGLNMRAVFNTRDLPLAIKKQFTDSNISLSRFNQLILVGHGGKKFWHSFKESETSFSNPVDDYVCALINDWLESFSQPVASRIIYPGPCDINLQALGQLAGWHHDSPFMLGINSKWGSWFAYRALVLADTAIEPLENTMPATSPCSQCPDKPCTTCCPGAAVSEKEFLLENCLNYRKSDNSQCQTTCLSRMSCPVSAEHRYSDEQIN
jgi:epoxyqueuosine reductase